MINGKQSFHFHDSRKYNTPTNRKRDGIGAGGGEGVEFVMLFIL